MGSRHKYRPPLSERFWPKVLMAAPDECWLWGAYIAPEGYGRIHAGRDSPRPLLAHRVAYELLVGPIPEGLTLDHLCRNRGCVNPAHLEPVTNRENIMRGTSVPARNARKTHCKHGHVFSPENTRLRRDGSRICNACRLARRTLPPGIHTGMAKLNPEKVLAIRAETCSNREIAELYGIDNSVVSRIRSRKAWAHV